MSIHDFYKDSHVYGTDGLACCGIRMLYKERNYGNNQSESTTWIRECADRGFAVLARSGNNIPLDVVRDILGDSCKQYTLITNEMNEWVVGKFAKVTQAKNPSNKVNGFREIIYNPADDEIASRLSVSGYALAAGIVYQEYITSLSVNPRWNDYFTVCVGKEFMNPNSGNDCRVVALLRGKCTVETL